MMKRRGSRKVSQRKTKNQRKKDKEQGIKENMKIISQLAKILNMAYPLAEVLDIDIVSRICIRSYFCLGYFTTMGINM